jgi:hypothetical protein
LAGRVPGVYDLCWLDAYGYDEAVAAQAAGLLERAGRDLRAAEFARLLERAPEPARRGFAAYLAFSP